MGDILAAERRGKWKNANYELGLKQKTFNTRQILLS